MRRLRSVNSWKEIDCNDRTLLSQVLRDRSKPKTLRLHANLPGPAYYFPLNATPGQSDIEEAEKLLQGYFKAESYHPEVKIPIPPHWDEDPLYDNNWKFILHSLRWLETLINAYLITKNDTYLQQTNELIKSWISGNTPDFPKSRYSWSPHSVSYRLRMFVWYWKVFSNTNLFHSHYDFNTMLLLSIYQHIRYLADEENYNFSSNQSLDMLGALISASYTFSKDFKGMKMFFKWGANKLINYIKHNFSSKGYHLEQTPSYHCYALERIILISDYIRKNIKGVTLLPMALDKYTQLAWKALHHLAMPDKTLPLLGDCKLVDIDELFEDYKTKKFQLPNMPVYLPLFDICPQAGYAIFRSNTKYTYAILKCNNFVSGHYHNDYMSCILYAFNQTWIVDPGYYCYNENDDFRKYFRSSMAHNSILINGEGSNVKNPEESRAILDIGCQPYHEFVRMQRTFPSGFHERLFMRLNEFRYSIQDLIKLDKTASIEQVFHIHPDLCIDFINENTVKLTNTSGDSCYIEQLGCNGGWETVKGQVEPSIMGWYSDTYNTKVASTVLKYVTNKEAVKFSTEIRWVKGSQ